MVDSVRKIIEYSIAIKQPEGLEV